MQLLPWFLGFNPVIEAPKRNFVWVTLPRLPLKLRTKKYLRAIGNSIGRTKKIDTRIIGTYDKCIS